MSKWIIVSDNHTEAGILYQIIAWHQDYDVALHLGDSEFEYHDTELSLFQKGNCDFIQNFQMKNLSHLMILKRSILMAICILLIVDANNWQKEQLRKAVNLLLRTYSCG